MNQFSEWTGRCQLCCKPTEDYTMSARDVKLVCLECAKSEWIQHKNRANRPSTVGSSVVEETSA
jgi:hypothetical protein